jgi:hypothetical protein
MFFAMTNALLDASIVAWEAKQFYDYVRPVTAIHFLFEGQMVKAWSLPRYQAYSRRNVAALPSNDLCNAAVRRAYLRAQCLQRSSRKSTEAIYRQ